MPPPGSPPQHSPALPLLNGSAQHNHLPNPPSFGPIRDGVAPFSHTRSNNMSISSIMGSDNLANHRPRTSWSASSSRAPPLSGPYQAPPSPRNQSHFGSKPEPVAQGRSGDMLATGVHFGPGPEGSSRYETARQSAPRAGSELPPRPYSQPTGLDGASRDIYEMRPEPSNGFALLDSRIAVSQEQRSFEERASRDRSHSDVAGSRRAQYAQHGEPFHHRSDLQEGRTTQNGLNERVDWVSEKQDVQPYGGPPEPEYGPFPRPSEYDGRGPFAQISQNPDAQLVYGLPSQGPNGGHHSGQLVDHTEDRHAMRPSMSSEGYHSRNVALDTNLRRSLEESQMPMKAIIQDARRLDRGSPLPQAVQGASSQPFGLGRDPHVKREFGNIFSGLGSGIGSTPQPTSHPHGHPPDLEDMEGDFSGARRPMYDHFGGRGSRVRSKRAYDDDGRLDSGDSADGRASPVSLARGGKRSKFAHTHHHHHHVQNHQIEDDAPQDANRRRTSLTPMGSSKYSSTNGQGAAPLHHHHHHHTHHHHHNARMGAQAAPVIMRRPVVTIKTRPLIESLSHKPRRHLGSQVYTPKIIFPSSASTTITSKRKFATEPNPLPRFHGKENCTFMIRVHRDYLTPSARERVCAQRRIWGTDVYTDDSDPICAAIHAGWFKGSWADDVDTALLDLEPASSDPQELTGSHKDQTAGRETSNLILESVPTTAGIKDPPEGKDMHITLLILPALENYASSTWHGVRSRAWGNNHDGMSFKIERVEFVDEGADWSAIERGPGGTKERLKRRDGHEGTVGTPQYNGPDVLPILAGFADLTRQQRRSGVPTMRLSKDVASITVGKRAWAKLLALRMSGDVSGHATDWHSCMLQLHPHLCIAEENAPRPSIRPSCVDNSAASMSIAVPTGDGRQAAIRESRRQLQQKIRNDWQFSSEPSCPTLSTLAAESSAVNDEPSDDNKGDTNSLGGSPRLSTVLPQFSEWRERTYASSDPSSDEDPDSSSRRPDSLLRRKRDILFGLQSHDLQDPATEPHEGVMYGTSLPEDFERRRREVRKRRRRRKLEEEMAWNEGLRFWQARRDAWCCAKVMPHEEGTEQVCESHDSGHGSTETPSEEDDSLHVQHVVSGTMLVPVAPALIQPGEPSHIAITPTLYPSIYSKIVVQSLTPSVPINLSHMVHALVDGWKRDGEWPPKATAASPSILNPAKTTTAPGEGYGARIGLGHFGVRKGMARMRRSLRLSLSGGSGTELVHSLCTVGRKSLPLCEFRLGMYMLHDPRVKSVLHFNSGGGRRGSGACCHILEVGGLQKDDKAIPLRHPRTTWPVPNQMFTSPEKGWRTVPLTFDKHRTDDRELWSKIRIVYRDELEKPWRRMLAAQFSNAGVPKRQQPKDGTSSHEFMHAYHHPRAFRPADHNWIDWFVQYKTDPSKSYGLEFVEGLWAEKLAFIAICFTVGIIITSVVWCVKGGDLQTVFTVMGFVLSGVAGEC
ncbi:hypothetical protein FH972_001622 [Carpinus fangiana]|uniref:Gag1-like clamp domain-containing protein n=1 Tax=Carpinus fangiana TaxID=176857 RepID=A0A5N6QCG7_9ROSI|nr:hypothetical protein FH972_001622 [Carpinus fangiana]